MVNQHLENNTLCSLLSLTIHSVVLFVAAFAQDGGGAVVEDGGGLNGRQAGWRDGGPTGQRGGFGWTGVCFCRWVEEKKRCFRCNKTCLVGKTFIKDESQWYKYLHFHAHVRKYLPYDSANRRTHMTFDLFSVLCYPLRWAQSYSFLELCVFVLRGQ